MPGRIPERWQAVLLAVLVLGSVIGLLAAAGALNPSAYPGEAHDVSLRVEGAGWTIRYEAAETRNHTAFTLLLEAGDRLGFTVLYHRYASPLDSVLVESINGSRNGAGDLWWLYWVDGRYGDVGADRKVLGDGSQVLWAFRTYPPAEATG